MGEITWSDLPPKPIVCRKTDANGGSCNVGDQEAEIKLSKQLVTRCGAMISRRNPKENRLIEVFDEAVSGGFYRELS